MSAVAIPFHEVGTVDDTIDVEITYQIIGLFSEGLYSSPYKALEELVSNAFDADAGVVHVVVPADLGAPSASIAVIDNGTGMDASGLKVHWIVGDSIKQAAHNPEVAGSNPAPATQKGPGTGPFAYEAGQSLGTPTIGAPYNPRLRRSWRLTPGRVVLRLGLDVSRGASGCQSRRESRADRALTVRSISVT
jgi:histidine kinase/DNA gyrase B/HSP90-like ATPase